MRRTLPILLPLLAASMAPAQSGLVGRFAYPQFRGLSALPGGGVGLRPDGRPSIDGALAFSSPIAYALKPGRLVLAASSVSRDGALRFSGGGDGDLNVNANGTGAVLYGTDLRFARLTVAGMIFSGQFDNGYNLHFTPKQEDEYDDRYDYFRPLQFAVGVQDVFGNGGTSGDTRQADPALDAADKKNSASLYAVGTYALPRGLYASAGIGTGRFRFGFASLSAPALRRTRLAVEHDGFNFNVLLAYAPPLKIGREGGTTVGLGLVRGRYATLTAALHF